jgi:hypothetical protein
MGIFRIREPSSWISADLTYLSRGLHAIIRINRREGSWDALHGEGLQKLVTGRFLPGAGFHFLVLEMIRS